MVFRKKEVFFIAIILLTILLLGGIVYWFYLRSVEKVEQAKFQSVVMPISSVILACRNLGNKVSDVEIGGPICVSSEGEASAEIKELWPIVPAELAEYSYDLSGDFIEAKNKKGEVFFRCNIHDSSCE